jgi:hypothetical protein
MALVTVTGSFGNTSVVFPTSTAIQTALAQQVLEAAFSAVTTQLVTGPGGATTSPAVFNIIASGSASAATELVTGLGGLITSPLVVDIATSTNVLTGTAAIPTAQVALGGQSGVYITGGTAVSTVVAADNTGSSIVNDSSSSALLAATGAGGNVLLGLSGANNFSTGTLGNDIVYLDGAANSLTSNGSDAVLVGGPSTVTAALTGSDNILLTYGTTLNFINGSQSGAVDSITGAANSTVVAAGYGAESIASGIGPETFYVDTSAGNVTLNGNLQGNDIFEFVKNHDNATANIVVNNLGSGDALNLHGYGSFNVAPAAGNAAGSVLMLSDGSQVTFNNVSTAVLQQTIKTV